MRIATTIPSRTALACSLRQPSFMHPPRKPRGLLFVMTGKTYRTTCRTDALKSGVSGYERIVSGGAFHIRLRLTRIRAARGDARVELHVGTLEPRTAVGGIAPPRAARAHDIGIGDVKIAVRAGTAGIGERIPPAGELDTDRMIVSEVFAEIGDDAVWTDAALRLRRLSAPDAIAKTGDLHAGTRLVDQGIHRLCSVVTRQAGQGDGAFGFDAAVERGGAELIIGLETGGIEITIPQRHGGIGVEAMRRMAEHADLTRPAVIARGIEPGRAQIVLCIEYPAISDAPHQPQHDRACS